MRTCAAIASSALDSADALASQTMIDAEALSSSRRGTCFPSKASRIGDSCGRSISKLPGCRSDPPLAACSRLLAASDCSAICTSMMRRASMPSASLAAAFTSDIVPASAAAVERSPCALSVHVTVMAAPQLEPSPLQTPAVECLLRFA